MLFVSTMWTAFRRTSRTQWRRETVGSLSRKAHRSPVPTCAVSDESRSLKSESGPDTTVSCTDGNSRTVGTRVLRTCVEVFSEGIRDKVYHVALRDKDDPSAIGFVAPASLAPVRIGGRYDLGPQSAPEGWRRFTSGTTRRAGARGGPSRSSDSIRRSPGSPRSRRPCSTKGGSSPGFFTPTSSACSRSSSTRTTSF